MDLPKVVQVEKNVHEFIFNVSSSSWSQETLLMSDIHFDSKKCDKKLLKKHLLEARERNAQIFIFGDFQNC